MAGGELSAPPIRNRVPNWKDTLKYEYIRRFIKLSKRGALYNILHWRKLKLYWGHNPLNWRLH